MNYYLAESAAKHVHQVVIELPKGSEQESKFGMMFFSGKFLPFMMTAWTTGFFRMDSDPGPFLMIRGDNVASKLRGSSMKVAFCFYQMTAGALVTVYVHADCPEVAKNLKYPIVLFEMAYGCDQEDTRNLIRDAFSSEHLHLCFAEGDGPGEMVGGAFCGSSVDAQYDIIVPLSSECRKVLNQELDAALKYHASLPANRRDFQQSGQQMYAENPQTESPILPRPQSTNPPADAGTGKSKRWWEFWK